MGVGGAAALAAFGARATAQAPRPNVLWIVDDDHPPYMMDPMPFTRRRIRDQGVNLYSGHADIPLCGPARVSLLTGLSATTHGHDTNQTYRGFHEDPRGLEDRTVAAFLKAAGYETAHFGKYINGYGSPEPAPHWDFWRGTRGGGPDNPDAGPAEGSLDGAWVSISSQPSMWAANRLAGYIKGKEGSSTPWFAQYCPTIPHQPYTPTSDFEHLYDDANRAVPSTNEGDMSDKPAWMRNLNKVDASEIKRVAEGKKEGLADLDKKCIKPIVEALANSGQLANTVIFFTSDNGYMIGEHRLEQKDQPYWESAEMPFFVRGFGVKKSPALVSHVDPAPTTCELAGVSPATLGMDGRSMVALLTTDAPFRKRLLVAGSDDVGPELNPGGSDDPSGRWWLLAEGTKRFILRENGVKELYWMGADPFQNRSRHEEADPALIRRLTDTVEAMRRASGEERRALEATPA